MHEPIAKQSQSASGYVATGTFIGLSVVAGYLGLWKLLGIGWLAFGAMGLGIAMGGSPKTRESPTRVVWGYGTASGAMLTSACVFLVSQAIEYDPQVGGFGIAAGIMAGFALHTVGHWLTHRGWSYDPVTTELTIHALAAGAIIGTVYSVMPRLDLLLGFAIVSHKAPAGYVAAKRLSSAGVSLSTLLIPSAAIGLASLPIGLVGVSTTSTLHGLIFGFGAGVFLHLSMDFFPRCELGGEIYDVAQLREDQHELLDRLRFHAILSTFSGGLAVLAIWLFV